VKKLRAWRADHDDKPGKTGKPRKRNVTDNDSQDEDQPRRDPGL